MIERAPPTRQLTLGDAFDARPNHRLFLGIWPDGPAAYSMTMLMQLLRRDGIMLGKQVETDRLHLTLFHLGDFVDQIPPSLYQRALISTHVPNIGARWT